MTSDATTRDVAQRHADLCAISWMLSKTTAPLNSAQKAAMMNSPRKSRPRVPKWRGGMCCRERCNYRHSFRLPLPRRSVLRWLKRRELSLGHDGWEELVVERAIPT